MLCLFIIICLTQQNFIFGKEIELSAGEEYLYDYDIEFKPKPATPPKNKTKALKQGDVFRSATRTPERDSIFFDTSMLSSPYCNRGCATRPFQKNVYNNILCKCAYFDQKQETEFVFYNTNEMRDFRTRILHLHNEERSNLAKGQSVYCNYRLGTISNMQLLNYDLELEAIAFCLARHVSVSESDTKDCYDKLEMAGEHETLYPHWNYQVYISYNNYNKSERASMVERHFREYGQRLEKWCEKKDSNLSLYVDNYTVVKEIAGWTRMVWAETRQIGCFQAATKTKSMQVCVGYPGGLKVGYSVFKRGPVATRCTKALRSIHYSGLCGYLLPIPRDYKTRWPSFWYYKYNDHVFYGNADYRIVMMFRDSKYGYIATLCMAAIFIGLLILFEVLCQKWARNSAIKYIEKKRNAKLEKLGEEL